MIAFEKLSKQEVLWIFQWIKYDLWLRWQSVYFCIKKDSIKLEKSVLSNIVQSMLFKMFKRLCLLPLARTKLESGEENERSIQYPNHSYEEDLNNFGNCAWICAQLTYSSLGRYLSWYVCNY